MKDAIEKHNDKKIEHFREWLMSTKLTAMQRLEMGNAILDYDIKMRAQPNAAQGKDN